jgi:hypothetical protein
LDEYKAFRTKSLLPKLVPIQPGLLLVKDDCPILPDPRKQKFYRSFIAKLQFAATWIHFNISFSVAQLARFCASPGKIHCAALHHLMVYLEAHPSFKLTYRKRSAFKQWHDWFCRFGLGYELIPPLYDGQLVSLQSLADLLAIDAAEDDCSDNSGGGVLLSISSGC